MTRAVQSGGAANFPVNSGDSVHYRWRVIQEILETIPRSAARRGEVQRAVLKWGISARTVLRWVQAFQESGGDVNALRRKVPKSLGTRRVWVSRVFDREFLAVGLDQKLLHIIASETDQLIRAAWASPVQRAGWKQVRREVLLALRRFVDQEVKVQVPGHAFALSQRRIREARYYRAVDVRAHDRKTFDDHRPRIRRRNDLLRPMQQIVMDVKVIDCLVTRPDGTSAWPRMIAFMDTGTHRIFRRFFLLRPGEGIRQEHVVSSFLEMADDPEWGFPEQLYRDNGSEFYILDKIRSALDQLRSANVRTIINARPYAAASKPIESKFAVLDRFVFSQMSGWAGGNRMRQKTDCVGRPPAPFKGSFEEFVQEADGRISIFEDEPIGSGPFEGKIPRRTFFDHVERGWRPVSVSRGRLDAAFCTRETRRVSRGCLKIAGRFYRHPQLVNGQRVTIALPWRRGAQPLAQVPELGWIFLEEDLPYLPTLLDGARESQKRARQYEALTRVLKQKAGTIDLEANRRDRLAGLQAHPRAGTIADADIFPAESALSEALARRSPDPASTNKSRTEARTLKTTYLEAFLGTADR